MLYAVELDVLVLKRGIRPWAAAAVSDGVPRSGRRTTAAATSSGITDGAPVEHAA